MSRNGRYSEYGTEEEVDMEIKAQASVDVVEDVICDVCKGGTRIPGYGLQYGSYWGRADG